MGATAGGSGTAFVPVEQKRRIFVRDSDSQPQSSSLALPGQSIVSVTVVGRPASLPARPEGRAGEYRKARRSGNARRRASRFWHFRTQGRRGTTGATAGGSGAAFMPVEQKRRIFVRDSDSQPQSSSLALPGQSIVSVTVVGRPASLPARPEGRAGCSRNMKTGREFTVVT